MARGWESKSVEMQMEERRDSSRSGSPEAADPSLRRELELLELSRKRLLFEIESASDSRLKELKKRALSHVDEKIRAHPLHSKP